MADLNKLNIRITLKYPHWITVVMCYPYIRFGVAEWLFDKSFKIKAIHKP